ncbi:YdcF family protein [Peribacillus sp. Hz7]|uniref:YdcF family protein n=1 Tax=Peribacillus sp. Hz7 TaxID=3344873 RepID=UPI0035C97C9B
MLKRKTLKKVMMILFGVILLFMVTVNSAGNFLVIDEKTVKSDVIIVLSGGEGRLEKGVKLYKEGFASYLLLSNGSVEQLYERAQKLGVPKDSIIMEVKSMSTLENARFSKEVMLKHKFQSAIVVSSNFHMRRVKVLFDQAFRNSDIKLTYVSGENEAYTPKKWWSEKWNRDTTFTEYIKLVGNLFGFHGEDSKEYLKKLNLQ